MRGRAEPTEEPARPAKLDGWSMTYHLTSLGIRCCPCSGITEMHGYADRVVKVRPEEKLIRRTAQRRDGASLLRSGQPKWRQAAPDSKMRSDNEVGI